jgi:hypothetical protein
MNTKAVKEERQCLEALFENIDFPDHDINDAVEVKRFTIGDFKKEKLKKRAQIC